MSAQIIHTFPSYGSCQLPYCRCVPDEYLLTVIFPPLLLSLYPLPPIRRIVLDVRKPPQGRIDPGSPYVAFSRATKLEDISLLFPVSLRDLNKKRDADLLALIDCLNRLAKDTLAAFRTDPGTFTACAIQLQLEDDDDDFSSTEGQGAPSQRGRGSAAGSMSQKAADQGEAAPPSLSVRLIPNNSNNCFFNAALALVIAVFDNQPIPAAGCTPAATAFFSAVELVRDSMFSDNPLPQHVLVRRAFCVIVACTLCCQKFSFPKNIAFVAHDSRKAATARATPTYS